MKNINERNNFVFEFRPVTELFEEQVKLHPEKCAVVSGKESFTYAQLNERANRIANALVEKGVRRETIVGVVLERCCDFYAVRQGILKAGAHLQLPHRIILMTGSDIFLKIQELLLLSQQRRSQRNEGNCLRSFPAQYF